MNQRIALGLAMLAGAAIGAAAVNGLNAQTKAPGAYAGVDISEVTNPDDFGGKFVIRTDNISALDGTPPKRFVVIAFDSAEKAKAWDKSPAQDEVNAIRKKSTQSRTFIADGSLN
jgi:uncharacterized protein (DUF1330 family)